MFNEKDQENRDLVEHMNGLTVEINNSRVQFDDLARYANELNDRINQGIEEIGRCKEAIMAYDAQFQEGKSRESHLEEQIAMLEPLIQENSNLKEDIFKLK
jgi:ABC-type transporter Mla subunit MlaD